MDLSEINILELLPQQQPFIMVDRILHIDDTKTITELTIRKNNLFFDDGRLSASGLIENIAQTWKRLFETTKVYSKRSRR